MSKTGMKILLSGIFSLAIAQVFGNGTGTASSGVFLWLYLALLAFLISLSLTFVLQKNQKKASRRMSKLQTSIKTLQQNLTSIKENREEIIQQRVKALHIELERLKQNLKAMEETLKTSKLSARRNSLLMTKISNTLRTNLNDILGFSSLLGNEFALSEEKELFEYNENIRKSGESLIHLLNNIIDISKTESKSFNLNEEECNLTEITRGLIVQYKPAAGQKGLRIVFRDDKIPPFASDGQAVKHILANLLDNAVRYTEKGFIKISQTLQDKQIVWTIKDTGMGIDKAYLPDIFEPFRQQSLGYSKTAYQGAGLGLPLIKSMLDIMNGSIEIESEKAVGTTVRIYLPFKKHTSKSKITESEQPATKNKKPAANKIELKKANIKILVLDKDKFGNMLIKKILPRAVVEIYGEGGDPYEWLRQHIENKPLPDIFIIELNFPEKGRGAATLQNIREKYPETGKIPAIVLSAYPDNNGLEKAIRHGFTGYLSKPIHKNDLISLINQLIPS
jgi:signal transduction histidine kinase/CheY-like chemotaxis protein